MGRGEKSKQPITRFVRVKGRDNVRGGEKVNIYSTQTPMSGELKW